MINNILSVTVKVNYSDISNNTTSKLYIVYCTYPSSEHTVYCICTINIPMYFVLIVQYR